MLVLDPRGEDLQEVVEVLGPDALHAALRRHGQGLVDGPLVGGAGEGRLHPMGLVGDHYSIQSWHDQSYFQSLLSNCLEYQSGHQILSICISHCFFESMLCCLVFT